MHKNSLAIRSKIIAKERESRPIKSALISSYEKEMLVSWEWKVCVCVCWSLFQSITTQLAPTSIQKLFARVTLSSQARMVQKPSNSIKQMLWSQQVLARDSVNLFLLWIGAFYPRPNRLQKHINSKYEAEKRSNCWHVVASSSRRLHWTRILTTPMKSRGGARDSA